MKKFFYLAVAACAALAACSKNEVVSVTPDQEITYQTISTKAASAMGTGNKFYSWAYFLPQSKTWESNKTEAKLYISNALISHTTSNIWKSTTTYYWPKQGSLTFFAWSDNDGEPTITAPATVSCDKTNGVKIDNYNVATDKNKDLLVAKISANQTKTDVTNAGSWAQSGVPTVFYHILSSLELKAKTKEDYTGGATINVKSVVFNDVNIKGTYTQGVNASALPTDASWVNTSDVQNLDIYAPSSPSANVTNSGIDLTASNGEYSIVLPQDFTSSSATAVITYTIKTSYSGSEVTETVVETKPLKDIFTAKWLPGHKYILTITIGLDEILWDPVVEPWTDTNVSLEI